VPTSLKEDFVAGQAPGLTWGNGIASWANDQSTRWYNVLEYGAAGNGATDDTTAIQNAIDAAYAAGGGVAYFPHGRYRTTASLTLKYRVSMLGYNSNFSTNTVLGRPCIVLDAAKNVSILKNDRVNGLVQQGDQRFNQSFIRGMAFFGNSTAGQTDATSYGLDIQECWGLEIENCQIMQCYGHAIYLYSCNDIAIRNCVVMQESTAHSAANCVRLEDVADLDITGCRFGGGNGSIVYIAKKASGINNRTWLFKIHDNLIFNSLAGNGVEVVDCTDSLGIEIAGNRVDQNYLNGISVNNSPGNLIMGNVCALNGLDNETGQAGIYVVTSADTCIVGNVCTEGASGIGENQDYGIDIGANCDYSTLTGNSVRGNDTAGIRISGTGNANVRAQGNPSFADQ
jgi:hypothetical protein